MRGDRRNLARRSCANRPIETFTFPAGANRTIQFESWGETLRPKRRFIERWLSQMPEQETLERAHEDAREGKAPSTQAGEFVREEIHHVREGKHGARNAKQAIAIGLSKARRAGVKLGTPNPKTTSAATRKKAAQDDARGRKHVKPSPKRSRATEEALEREGHAAGSRRALSRHAHQSATVRGKKSRV